MRPYYDDGQVTLYHGDALEVLPQLPRGCAHLIVTDPPYGIRYQSGHRIVRPDFDAIAGDEDTDVAIEGLRLALNCLPPKGHRHVYAFGRYDLSSLPLSAPVELIWDKTSWSGGNLALPWGKAHEYIQFAVHRGGAFDQKRNAGALAARMRRGSILRYPRIDGNVLRHPTEKPVDLLRELIESSSRIGETVLDPFAGVGSTLVAARLEGRRAIGIEIEEKYCEVAVQRLQQVVLPLEALP